MFEREDRGGVAVLRMSHGKANALDIDFSRELQRVLGDIRASDATSLVLVGNDKIFSAGVDLPQLLAGGKAYIHAFLPAITEALTELFFFEQPVVAAASAHAIAGGCMIVGCCDYRVFATGGARIGVTEMLVGVPFPSFGLELLRFAIPPHALQRALYLGETFTAEEALRLGLVDEIAAPDRVLDRACEVAEWLGAINPDAFRISKEQLRSPMQALAREYSAKLDREITDVWCSERTLATIRGFVEKNIKPVR